MNFHKIPKIYTTIINKNEISNADYIDFHYNILLDLQQFGIPLVACDKEQKLDTVDLIFDRKHYYFNTEDLKILDLAKWPLNKYRHDEIAIPHYSELCDKEIYIPCKFDNEWQLFKAQYRAAQDLLDLYIKKVKLYIDNMNRLALFLDEHAKSKPDNYQLSINAVVNSIYGTVDIKENIPRIHLE